MQIPDLFHEFNCQFRIPRELFHLKMKQKGDDPIGAHACYRIYHETWAGVD